jgi:hypothetical protein
MSVETVVTKRVSEGPLQAGKVILLRSAGKGNRWLHIKSPYNKHFYNLMRFKNAKWRFRSGQWKLPMKDLYCVKEACKKIYPDCIVIDNTMAVKRPRIDSSATAL